MEGGGEKYSNEKEEDCEVNGNENDNGINKDKEETGIKDVNGGLRSELLMAALQPSAEDKCMNGVSHEDPGGGVDDRYQ